MELVACPTECGGGSFVCGGREGGEGRGRVGWRRKRRRGVFRVAV